MRVVVSVLSFQLVQVLLLLFPPAGESRPPTRPLPARGTDPMDRIVHKMQRSQELLSRRQIGDETIQLQQSILADLDAFLAESKSKPAESPGATTGTGAEQSAATQSGLPEPQTLANTPADEPLPGRSPRGASARAPAAASASPASARPNVAELYKDVWGHLPDALRPEMDQYSREEFIPQYRTAIQQYYRTISEKARREGE